MSMVKLLGKVEKFELLTKEIESISNQKLDAGNQVSLQTTESTQDDWYCGVGSAYRLKDTNESSYNLIQPSLKGTYLESLIDKFRGFRARIMRLTPKSCYSVHADSSFRIHIPIITNKQCWMVWPVNQVNVCLQAGNIYWTNTQHLHSAFNGSMEDRIHLVMCVSKPW